MASAMDANEQSNTLDRHTSAQDASSQPSTPGSEISTGRRADKKGPWSAEEDERLRAAVGTGSKHPRWADIANMVQARSAKQCRERWEQNLNPAINKDPITHDEGLFIISFVDEQGKKWAEIARQLVGRADNSIKNWYNGMAQKGKTGRASTDDRLYRHFSARHQAVINQNGRRPLHRYPTSSFGTSRRAHQYHPYSHPMRSPRAQYAQVFSNDAQVPLSMRDYPAQMPAYPSQAPIANPYPYGGSVSSPAAIGGENPLESCRLPPIRTRASELHAESTADSRDESASSSYSQNNTAHMPAASSAVSQRTPTSAGYGRTHGYFDQQPAYAPSHIHVRRNLTVNTSNAYQRRSSGSLSMSPRVDEDSSVGVPSMSGSTTSTPMQGSPLTPSLTGHSSYSHVIYHEPRDSVEREMKYIYAGCYSVNKRPRSSGSLDDDQESAAKPKKMSIQNLCN